jgi:hypothetical protein
MKSYQYKPLQHALQEIRLVHLLPGGMHDKIRFRLLHVPLPLPTTARPKARISWIGSAKSSVSWPWDIEETECGDIMKFNVVTGERQILATGVASSEGTSEYQLRYEALSYTWGDAEVSESGFVQGCEDNGECVATLGLRPNLAVALRQLRHPYDSRILWIDAICINQGDVDERNEQVKRMTNIYALARRVVAWLGGEFDDSKHALATLQYVGQQLEATRSGRVIAAIDAVEPLMWRNDYIPSFNQRTWQALAMLVERAWFYRVWCWQEIKLGSSDASLQCGSDTISWNTFWLAVLCIHNKDNLPSTRFRERCRHILFLKYDPAGHSMSNILDISRSKGCTNPRDKIYGLLGIAPTYFGKGVVVNYLKPVQDVYKEAFVTYLNTTKRLELLKHCVLGDRKIGGPSWVPDWSQTEFAAPILSEQLSSGISQACFTYIGADLLDVVGKQYTTIKTLSGIASKIEEKTLFAVGNWFQHLPNNSTYVTGETIETAFALTLCMNRTRERHPYNHFLSTREWVTMVRNMLHLDAASQDDPIFSARETANTIQKLRGRRFFTTETGHIGTAPAGVEIGKLVIPSLLFLLTSR